MSAPAASHAVALIQDEAAPSDEKPFSPSATDALKAETSTFASTVAGLARLQAKNLDTVSAVHVQTAAALVRAQADRSDRTRLLAQGGMLLNGAASGGLLSSIAVPADDRAALIILSLVVLVVGVGLTLWNRKAL